ncbi:MAG: ribbon-helix-helix domain-containing protein [gamma proteobacterium symbiont of Taylorina sp.]|nr:ribbon-helix-helix domain-containing protein [gamma proteobacterium symbiont of Taylorina sp.]
MRTLVDIPEQQISELSLLCREQKLSRAELIRRAITAYIGQQNKKESNAFGLWKKENQQTKDGLQYQQELRHEW